MSKEQIKTYICQSQIQQSILGKGSLGEVIQKIDKDKIYAIKKIQKIKVDRLGRRIQLDRQIEIMKRLQHQNIVKFFKFKQNDPRFYQIQMELCPGKDLRRFLNSDQYRNQILPSKAKQFAVKVCLDIISAYSELRSHLVINRDIKLDNIMVDIVKEGGKQKIITKMIDFSQSKFHIQQALTHTGTHGYMSPQIYFRTDYGSQKCDYWALGLTFYQLFEGVKMERIEQKRLSCPFKQNFYPKDLQDYKQLYNKYIFEDISLTKCRTPKPFRKIIRGLLKINTLQRIGMIKMIQILLEQFKQIQQCFSNQQQITTQKNKLLMCLNKNTEANKKKMEVEKNLQKIKNIYYKLFLKFNQNLPQPKQSKKNVQILKIIIIIINKILKLVLSIQGLMEVTSQYAKKQIFNTILSEDMFYRMVSDFQSYRLFLTRNKIQPNSKFVQIHTQVLKFILKSLPNCQNQTIQLIQRELKQ